MFLHDEKARRDIPGHKPVPTTTDAAVAAFDGLTLHDANFIGFVLEDDTTVQFIWSAGHDWTVDIPRVAEKGSYVRQMSADECRSLIRKLGPAFSVESVPGLVFAPWSG